MQTQAIKTFEVVIQSPEKPKAAPCDWAAVGTCCSEVTALAI